MPSRFPHLPTMGTVLGSTRKRLENWGDACQFLFAHNLGTVPGECNCVLVADIEDYQERDWGLARVILEIVELKLSQKVY